MDAAYTQFLWRYGAQLAYKTFFEKHAETAWLRAMREKRMSAADFKRLLGGLGASNYRKNVEYALQHGPLNKPLQRNAQETAAGGLRTVRDILRGDPETLKWQQTLTPPHLFSRTPHARTLVELEKAEKSQTLRALRYAGKGPPKAPVASAAAPHVSVSSPVVPKPQTSSGAEGTSLLRAVRAAPEEKPPPYYELRQWYGSAPRLPYAQAQAMKRYYG